MELQGRSTTHVFAAFHAHYSRRVCQALYIPANTLVAAESSPGLQKHLKKSFGVRISHLVKDVVDLTSDEVAKCCIHSAKCHAICRSTLPQIDLMTLGPPCQPFTNRRQRSGNTKSTGASAEHPLFALSTSVPLRAIGLWKPRGVILEQVEAFAAEVPESAHGSWLADLQAGLSDLGYCSSAFKLRLSDWITCSRDRFHMVRKSHSQ